MAARQLNLKGHRIEERKTQQMKMLYGPVDIEGHLGTDGRCYLVDTARVFPPATPSRDVKGCHLFRLLRPEWVKKSPFPLSSDAFTVWGKDNRKVNNGHVIAATDGLIFTEIPGIIDSKEFEDFVNAQLSSADVQPETLSTIFHRKGVNMRYLGVMTYFLKERQSGPSGEGSEKPTPKMKFVWTEMVARSCRAMIRTAMRELANPRTRDMYHDHVASLLNQMLNPKKNLEFWGLNGAMRASLTKKFIYSPQKGIPDIVDQKKFLPAVDHFAEYIDPRRLLKLIARMSGIHLTEDAQKTFLTVGAEGVYPSREVRASDIAELGFTYKFLTILPFTNSGEVNYEEAEKYFRDELEIKQKSLGNFHPQIALTLANLGELYKEHNKPALCAKVMTRAVQIMEKQLGKGSIDLARMYERRGGLYVKYQKWDMALTDFKKANDIREKAAEQNAKTNTSDSAAGLIADSDEALELAYNLETLAKISIQLVPIESNKDTTKAANYINDAGSYYDRALEIKRTHYKSHYHPDIAATENDMFEYYMAIGNTEKAEQVAKDVIKNLKPAVDINTAQQKSTVQEAATTIAPSAVGVAYDHLGELEVGRGDYNKAEEMFGESVRIKVLTLGKNHSSFAGTMDRLGWVQAENGKFDKAESSYKAAIEIYKKNLGLEHTDLAIVLNNLAALKIKTMKKELTEIEEEEEKKTIMVLLEEARVICEKSKLPSEHRLVKSITENILSLQAPKKVENAEVCVEVEVKAKSRRRKGTNGKPKQKNKAKHNKSAVEEKRNLIEESGQDVSAQPTPNERAQDALSQRTEPTIKGHDEEDPGSSSGAKSRAPIQKQNSFSKLIGFFQNKIKSIGSKNENPVKPPMGGNTSSAPGSSTLAANDKKSKKRSQKKEPPMIETDAQLQNLNEKNKISKDEEELEEVGNAADLVVPSEEDSGTSEPDDDGSDSTDDKKDKPKRTRSASGSGSSTSAAPTSHSIFEHVRMQIASEVIQQSLNIKEQKKSEKNVKTPASVGNRKKVESPKPESPPAKIIANTNRITNVPTPAKAGGSPGGPNRNVEIIGSGSRAPGSSRIAIGGGGRGAQGKSASKADSHSESKASESRDASVGDGYSSVMKDSITTEEEGASSPLSSISFKQDTSQSESFGSHSNLILQDSHKLKVEDNSDFKTEQKSVQKSKKKSSMGFSLRRSKLTNEKEENQNEKKKKEKQKDKEKKMKVQRTSVNSPPTQSGDMSGSPLMPSSTTPSMSTSIAMQYPSSSPRSHAAPSPVNSAGAPSFEPRQPISRNSSISSPNSNSSSSLSSQSSSRFESFLPSSAMGPPPPRNISASIPPPSPSSSLMAPLSAREVSEERSKISPDIDIDYANDDQEAAAPSESDEDESVDEELSQQQILEAKAQGADLYGIDDSFKDDWFDKAEERTKVSDNWNLDDGDTGDTWD